ncbi:Type I restriction-modification system methyltransferase subunit [Mycobacteroides abscessus subsp. massiliense]|uniref:methyltransferase n=1 Tax=Mycobacteroides abscessus TaxID=36809 RepID=UPI0009A6560D|nr:methyltransferase [Mycobacteroides abscessus]SKT52047.1 Type I restriction-modification system methyltransferase subunit [Mycobacteroides abscessus subsp. massiliense]
MATEAAQLARDILGESSRIDGCVVRLTCGQLSRPEYVAVNKALEAMGGKWNRGQSGHVFPTDPGPALAAFVGGGALAKPARTAEGYVPTPSQLAADIVADHTRIRGLPDGAKVLEPSAGDGAFVRAILKANPLVQVTAVEPNAERLDRIGEHPSVQRINTTFEEFAASTRERFDAVVMNPPFAVPGGPSIWIDHVRMAFDLLADAGRLTSIAPSGLVFRQDRKHKAIRSMVQEHGGFVELADDAFKGSGTGVQTVVMWLDAVSCDSVAARV